MEELTQIITQKLKLINHYRSMPSHIFEKEQSNIADELLKEKRKENSREVLESRLLQSLSSRKIQAPYRMEQFLRQSQQLMKIYDPQFEFQLNENQQILTSIVALYVCFFKSQNCLRRAQQLNHIFKKSLCDRGMVIPTIMNWFVDWLRKTFKGFLKNTLGQINEKKKIEEQKKQRAIPRRIADQLQGHRASLQKIEEQLSINQHQTSLINIKKSKLLEPTQPNIQKPRKNNSQLQRKKSSIIHPHSNLDRYQKGQSPQKTQHIKRSPSIAQLRNKQASFIGRREKEQVQVGPIYNKQMFYSAFYEEVSDFYKFYSFIPELDMGYPRGFRKVDRREEIKAKLMEVVKSFARAQPGIRKSQQEYIENYEKYKRREVGIKSPGKKKKKNGQEGRRRTFQIKKSQQKPTSNHIQNQECLLKEKSSKKIKRRVSRSPSPLSTSQKPRIHSKTMEIQLPQIPKVKNDRSSLINLKKQRYQEETRQQNKRIRASADLYKDIQQINSLFQKNSLNRPQYSSRKSQDTGNYNQRYLQIDGLLEDYEGQLPDDGIFRLPKINK